MHQLVVSESRNSPSNPHEEKDEEKYFSEKKYNTKDTKHIRIRNKASDQWHVISTKIQSRNNS